MPPPQIRSNISSITASRVFDVPEISALILCHLCLPDIQRLRSVNRLLHQACIPWFLIDLTDKDTSTIHPSGMYYGQPEAVNPLRPLKDYGHLVRSFTCTASKIPRDSLKSVAEHCSMLESLLIEKMDEPQDRLLIKLAKLKKLKRFSIQLKKYHVDLDEFLVGLIKTLPRGNESGETGSKGYGIEDFEICGDGEVLEWKWVYAIAEAFPKLRRLAFSGLRLRHVVTAAEDEGIGQDDQSESTAAVADNVVEDILSMSTGGDMEGVDNMASEMSELDEFVILGGMDGLEDSSYVGNGMDELGDWSMLNSDMDELNSLSGGLGDLNDLVISVDALAPPPTIAALKLHSPAEETLPFTKTFPKLETLVIAKERVEVHVKDLIVATFPMLKDLTINIMDDFIVWKNPTKSQGSIDRASIVHPIPHLRRLAVKKLTTWTDKDFSGLKGRLPGGLKHLQIEILEDVPQVFDFGSFLCREGISLWTLDLGYKAMEVLYILGFPCCRELRGLHLKTRADHFLRVLKRILLHRKRKLDNASGATSSSSLSSTEDDDSVMGLAEDLGPASAQVLSLDAFEDAFIQETLPFLATMTSLRLDYQDFYLTPQVVGVKSLNRILGLMPNLTDFSLKDSIADVQLFNGLGQDRNKAPVLNPHWYLYDDDDIQSAMSATEMELVKQQQQDQCSLHGIHPPLAWQKERPMLRTLSIKLPPGGNVERVRHYLQSHFRFLEQLDLEGEPSPNRRNWRSHAHLFF